MYFRSQRDILLTPQERSTRFTIVQRLARKSSENTANAIIAELDALSEQAFRTISDDNGGIENGNDRIRCEPHRSKRLSDYREADINDIVWMLNSTPRKCLGFWTPIEAFAQEVSVGLKM